MSEKNGGRVYRCFLAVLSEDLTRTSSFQHQPAFTYEGARSRTCVLVLVYLAQSQIGLSQP